MNNNFYENLVIILKDFSLVLGIALLLFSLVVGVLMVIKPAMITRLNQKGSSAFSFRRSTRVLEIPNYVDHAFYHHHRIVGLIITLTSAYILYYFTQVYDAAVIGDIVAGSKYAGIIEILASSVRLFLLFTGLATLVIGLIMIIRPSLLKGFEAWANHWISTRQAAKPLAMERDQVNQLVYKYPRLVGIIIISLSLYAATGLIMIYI